MWRLFSANLFADVACPGYTDWHNQVTEDELDYSLTYYMR